MKGNARVIMCLFACLGLLWSGQSASANESTRLEYIQIATSATSEAVKWYQEYMDCEAVTAQPERVLCGGMALDFVARPTLGGSQGTGVDRIAFSYADVTAKMRSLEDVGVRGSGVRLQRFADGSTLQSIPGLYDHGFVFDPWGVRIELLQDPALQGFHHVRLASTDPQQAVAWYAQALGGTAADFKGKLPAVRFANAWLIVDHYPQDRGRPAATDERAIDHLGFVSEQLDATIVALDGLGAQVQDAAVPEDARAGAQRAFVSGPDGVLLALVEPGWAGIAPTAILAAEDAAPEEAYRAPRTPWGEPDLQGMWTGNAAHGIPLQRADDDSGEALTAEQAAARRERGTLGSIWGYEREWRDTTLGYVKSAPSRQAAMIIDPPDGRLPPMTERGQRIADETVQARMYPKLAGGPEDLTNYVRCITRGLPGMMMPSIYNNGLQIAQSPGYVAVQKEMIHETRVIPTRSNPAMGPKLKQWLGHSRGRWEGDTLVVEVRGFNGRAPYRGAGADLQLTERYTRVGESKLRYEFTVDDPSIWTAPWTGMFHFDLDNDQYELVEYACHEGNYGMTNILSAARARERLQANEPAGEE
ncbi:MAG: VOC family protein [Pseudomonadota bacterium]